jgi:hypothetical protein
MIPKYYAQKCNTNQQKQLVEIQQPARQVVEKRHEEGRMQGARNGAAEA